MTNVSVASTIRPTLPQAAQAAIDAEHKEGKAYGLMHDAFIEAVKIRYNLYATGLEEREASKRIERVMHDYFLAKKSPEIALSFVTPEHLRELINVMTIAGAKGSGDEQSAD